MFVQQIIHNIYIIIYLLIIRPYQSCILGYLGKKSRVHYSTKLEKPQNINIGSNVSIGRMSWLAANPLTGKDSCSLTIEDGTYIGNFSHIYCTSRIHIGKKVLLADKVYISDNLHSFNNIGIPIIEQPILQLSEVLIDEGAWIGENVCIIGSRIGKNSVIGSNAVVTKSIPDYCVAVGAPAKIIKRYCFETNCWRKTDSDGKFI
jgi:acetyltransferase-like isoleucine patch superfamily enzyme